jgi:hypothetical protein
VQVQPQQVHQAIPGGLKQGDLGCQQARGSEEHRPPGDPHCRTIAERVTT